MIVEFETTPAVPFRQDIDYKSLTGLAAFQIVSKPFNSFQNRPSPLCPSFAAAGCGGIELAQPVGYIRVLRRQNGWVREEQVRSAARGCPHRPAQPEADYVLVPHVEESPQCRRAIGCDGVDEINIEQQILRDGDILVAWQ